MWPTTMLMVWNLWSPGIRNPVWLVMEDEGVHVSLVKCCFQFLCCYLYIYIFIYIYIYMLHMFNFVLGGSCFFSRKMVH